MVAMQAPTTAASALGAPASLSSGIDITILPRDWPATSFRQVLSKFRAFRLHALQSAPKAFATTYEQQIKHPDEYWMQQFTNVKAVHFIATRHDNRASIARSADDDNKLVESQRIALERDWIGYVMLVRKTFDSIANVHFSTESQNINTEYHLNALFVESTARRQDVGRRLVFAAREHAHREVKNERAQILIMVDSWNQGAIALYAALGFAEKSVNMYLVDGEEREAMKMEYVLA